MHSKCTNLLNFAVSFTGMARKIYGIFMAAGQGLRMGGETPKQFLELGGVPVLERTIERFIEACPEMEIITVLPSNHFATWDNLCGVHNFNCRQRLVEGGITRFHSVKNALARVPDGATVLIHDGVRPFVSVELIRKMVELSGTHRGLIPVLPVTDTIKALKRDEQGNLCQTDMPDPERKYLFAAQTPQVFCSECIKEAYEQAYDTAFTDDASVARKAGVPLAYIEGERNNIKLTTPEDLAIALKCLL